MAVICCPIVALLRKSGNTSSSFSLCKPTTNRSFIKMLFDPGQSKKVRVKKENCFQNLQSQEMTTLFLCFCTLKILTPAEEIVEEYLGLNCNFLSKISWRKLVKALISCEDYQTEKKQKIAKNKSQKIGQSCTFVQSTDKRTTVKREIKKNPVKNSRLKRVVKSQALQIESGMSSVAEEFRSEKLHFSSK